MGILNCDYFIYYEKLPWSVHGMVTPNDDDTYSIFINNRLTDALQLAAFVHEIRHIQMDDLYNSKPLKDVEYL